MYLNTNAMRYYPSLAMGLSKYQIIYVFAFVCHTVHKPGAVFISCISPNVGYLFPHLCCPYCSGQKYSAVFRRKTSCRRRHRTINISFVQCTFGCRNTCNRLLLQQKGTTSCILILKYV